VRGLAIKDVAERTGLAAATIRMWEQRYGFPAPQRTASGYRQYTEADVETLKRVLAFRETGLSVPAALARARRRTGETDRPSIYGAIATADAPVRPQRLRKSTLLAISRAIEDEAMARAAGPVVVGAFQHERNYRAVEHRYQRLAAAADAAVVFADFPAVRHPAGRPVEVPITERAAIGNEWAVVIDAPGYAACLLAWEDPDTQHLPGLPDAERRFEALWTLDPHTVRRAAQVGGTLAGRMDPELGRRLDELLADRPLAVEEPAPALIATTNRILSYLEPPMDRPRRPRPRG
jgi:DICT domain-containing protein/predicted DNA-binding transcriptional regulator AlpA